VSRLPLEIDTRRYVEVKDPCPVYDGRGWHLFGTGITGPHQFELLHAVATKLSGPWQLRPPVEVTTTINGGCVAAPGVIAEGPRLHMFLQTDYNRLDGRIEHVVSVDGGQSFRHARTALTALPGTAEAGIYDPHPAQLGGECYLVYSAFSRVGEPDVHLARSVTGTWDGPWERLGPILQHPHVRCHNQQGDADYEWGLEGAQLIGLPNGEVLLNAVCFLPGAPAGSRQRVFLARAAAPTGPYDVVGPAISPLGGETSGENGHGTVVSDGDEMTLFFQERDRHTELWRYALATLDAQQLVSVTGAARRAA
jgi:hypothetical protein